MLQKVEENFAGRQVGPCVCPTWPQYVRVYPIVDQARVMHLAELDWIFRPI